MKIVIPDDYQDMVDQLDCFALIRHHEVTRYRVPALKPVRRWTVQRWLRPHRTP